MSSELARRFLKHTSGLISDSIAKLTDLSTYTRALDINYQKRSEYLPVNTYSVEI